MKILISGGTGFIGKNLIKNLLISKNIKILLITRNKKIKFNDSKITYIRNDLKFFGKQNMCSKLKFIILNNADKLTTDAQSALRRIIEEFNKKGWTLVDLKLSPNVLKLATLGLEQMKIDAIKNSYKPKG